VTDSPRRWASGSWAVRSTKYYDLLGVAPSASEDEIKKAFKKLAVQFHPDRVGEEERDAAAKRFAEISNAYDVLSDAEKRQAYDAYGEQGPQGGAGGFQAGGFDFGGIRFEFQGGGFPGGGFGFQQQQQQQQPQRETANLYKDGSRVKNVDKNTWDEEVSKDTRWVWVVEFYAPWCPHCKAFKDEFEKVAKNLDGIVRVAAVNCEKEKALCQAARVESYPTIKAVVGGTPADYRGARTATALSKWGISAIPDHVRAVRTASELQQLYAECLKADWHICVLFMSSKSDPSAQARTLAYRFGSQIFVMEAKTSQRDVLAAAGLTGAGVAAICGKGDRIVPYEGSKFTAGRIQQWLVGFASGQECVRGLRIEKGGDLSHLRRGELEAVLTVLGKTCVACYEKADYERLIFDGLSERGVDHIEL